MRIGLAQLRPVPGDIPQNVGRHLAQLEAVADLGLDALLFPELSLTGYLPQGAGANAIDLDDGRLAVLQRAADSVDVTLAVGAPLRRPGGVTIAQLILSPAGPRRAVEKQFLHDDEQPFYIAGPSGLGRVGRNNGIVLAICYELSVAAHAKLVEQAMSQAHPPQAYVACVAKVERNIAPALQRMAEIAERFAIPALMVNAVGAAAGEVYVGQSTVFDRDGTRHAHLTALQESVLVWDTEPATAEVV